MFHTDYSGLFFFVGAMILLVFAGLFITLAMDGSVSLSGKSDPKMVLELGEERIAELTKNCQELEAKDLAQVQLRKLASQVVAKESELAKWTTRKEDLGAAVREEQRELEGVQSAFADYKERYRSDLRRNASGTKFAELRTVSGKIFHEVIIKVLSKEELVISHRDGRAKIPVVELLADFRAKHHLDLGEAARLVRERKKREEEQSAKLKELARAKQEAERLAAEENERKGRRAGRNAPLDADTVVKIEILNTNISGLKDQYQSNQGRIRSARAQLGGGGRSPPGSLQTWEQRIRGLEAKQDQIQARIRQAEAEMRKWNPNYRSRGG